MNDLIFLEEDYVENIDLLDQPVDGCFSIILERTKFKIPDDDGKIYTDDRKKDWLYVYVFDDEGPIPHIHIYEKDSKGFKNLQNRGMCLSLVDNFCFNHGNHQDTIDKKDFINLTHQLANNRIKSPCAKEDGTYRTFSWWKYFVSGWNMLNPDYRIKPGTKMPKYDFDTMIYLGSNIRKKEMEDMMDDE